LRNDHIGKQCQPVIVGRCGSGLPGYIQGMATTRRQSVYRDIERYPFERNLRVRDGLCVSKRDRGENDEPGQQESVDIVAIRWS
jgi:hypothetical protein